MHMALVERGVAVGLCDNECPHPIVFTSSAIAIAMSTNSAVDGHWCVSHPSAHAPLKVKDRSSLASSGCLQSWPPLLCSTLAAHASTLSFSSAVAAGIPEL